MAHVRRDGGAGKTGESLEVAGGLRATPGKVRVDARDRPLSLHSTAGYRERGAGMTLCVGNQAGRAGRPQRIASSGSRSATSAPG